MAATRGFLVRAVIGCALAMLAMGAATRVEGLRRARAGAEPWVAQKDEGRRAGAAARAGSGADRTIVLDLEAGVRAAQLIVVAKLEAVSETTILQGGQTAQVAEQYRLRPVRVLKGKYDRQELLMTGNDLGITRFGDVGRRLQVGDLFLVILARQGLNWLVCNPLETLEQSIPRLTGEDDRLIAAVARLVNMTEATDRARAVGLLIEGLAEAGDRDGIPLLRALGRRPLIAAQTPGLLRALGRHLDAVSVTARIEAVRALRAVLEADYLEQGELRRGAAARIGGLLGQVEERGEATLRAPALDALAAVGPAARDEPSTAGWLKVDGEVPTISETVVRLRAIGESAVKDQRDAVRSLYEKLPLDSAPELQFAAARTFGRVDPAGAAAAIKARVERKARAGIGFASELAAAGELPVAEAAPVFLAASELELGNEEREVIARSAQRLRSAGTPRGEERHGQPQAAPGGGGLDDAVRERLAQAVADREAAQEVRLAALACLVAVNDGRLPGALRAAVRDVGIEGSELMRQVEAELVRRKIGIEAG